MDGVVRMQAARASRARFQTNLNLCFEERLPDLHSPGKKKEREKLIKKIVARQQFVDEYSLVCFRPLDDDVDGQE